MSGKHPFHPAVRLILILCFPLTNLALRPMPLFQGFPQQAGINGAVFVGIAGILLGLVFVTAGILLLIRIRRE